MLKYKIHQTGEISNQPSNVNHFKINSSKLKYLD